MSADILSDPNHPHGTTDGLRLGCCTVHCPAPVSCREVHYLYHGDLAFRRAIDAGLTPSEALAKAKAQPAVPRSPKQKPKAAPKPRAPRVQEPSKHEKKLRELHAQGMFDTDIADELGLQRRQVTAIRNSLELKPNRGIDPNVVRNLHSQGMSDAAIAAELNKSRRRPTHRRAIHRVRNGLGLPTHRTLATAGVSSS